MVDLTHVKWLPNRFGGSESKWTMQYNDKLYMVKFPDPNRAPKQTSLPYINNHFSEYIGCHIFQMLGIPAKTLFWDVLRRRTAKKRSLLWCARYFPRATKVFSLNSASSFYMRRTARNGARLRLTMLCISSIPM